VLYQTLKYQKTETVLVITLPAVKGQNGMAQLSSELRELCTAIAFDPSVRLIVLAGTRERSFVIGPDMVRPPSGKDEEAEALIGPVAEYIGKLDLPVIAAITGDAIGLGLELALACDLRIASEASRFGLPHVRTGLIPWDGGTQRLSRLVGGGKAMEMILTGEPIDAKEACRIGLINNAVPPGEVMPAVMDMAKKMSSKGPIALRYAKEAIYKGMDMTVEQGLRLEADLYLLLHTTQDRTEGIRAFQEKRRPQFEGK